MEVEHAETAYGLVAAGAFLMLVVVLAVPVLRLRNTVDAARPSAGIPMRTSKSRKRFMLRSGSSAYRTPAKIMYGLRCRYARYNRSSACS